MEKKNTLTQETIVKLYMAYVLEHNHVPKSIYKFATSNGFEEAEFYTFWFFYNFKQLLFNGSNVFFVLLRAFKRGFKRS